MWKGRISVSDSELLPRFSPLSPSENKTYDTLWLGADDQGIRHTKEDFPSSLQHWILWLARVQVLSSLITPAPPFSPSQGEKAGVSEWAQDSHLLGWMALLTLNKQFCHCSLGMTPSPPSGLWAPTEYQWDSWDLCEKQGFFVWGSYGRLCPSPDPVLGREGTVGSLIFSSPTPRLQRTLLEYSKSLEVEKTQIDREGKWLLCLFPSSFSWLTICI